MQFNNECLPWRDVLTLSRFFWFKFLISGASLVFLSCKHHWAIVRIIHFHTSIDQTDSQAHTVSPSFHYNNCKGTSTVRLSQEVQSIKDISTHWLRFADNSDSYSKWTIVFHTLTGWQHSIIAEEHIYCLCFCARQTQQIRFLSMTDDKWPVVVTDNDSY